MRAVEDAWYSREQGLQVDEKTYPKCRSDHTSVTWRPVSLMVWRCTPFGCSLIIIICDYSYLEPG